VGRYLNTLGRLTICHSSILSNFNYCPVTWHFCSKQNAKKMEKSQDRALILFIPVMIITLTYEDLLEKCKLPSLKTRRIRTIYSHWNFQNDQ